MMDLETARAMVSAAERDLRALENMTDSQSFATEVFGFHTQQVVEKCLKAWLSLKGVQYPRTHNIRHLIVLLEQTGTSTADLWDFVGLSAFAVQLRYEAYETIDEPMDREEMVRRTKHL
jgi:HEPN domain-containing protein